MSLIIEKQKRKVVDNVIEKEENLSTNKQRIAYIWLCHNNPDLLERVAKTLNYQNDAIFVHVDKKVDIHPFLKACSGISNCFFVEDRVENYWGGFNSVIATVKTIKLAMSMGDFSRFVLLQGQDYPLFSTEKIHEFFEENYKVEYCKAKDITISHEKGDYMKWAGYWCFDCPNNRFFVLMKFALSKINKLGIKYRKGIFKHKGEKWHVYKGWANFCLTRECVEYIIEVFDNNKKFNNFMKHRFPPDEIYFHTIIHNSKFAENVSKNIITRRSGEKTLLNLTYTEYPVQATIFSDKEDYQWLKETGCLFVRKVNNTSSAMLLDEIDKSF